ncbi:hypothetical protein GVN21_18620 [Caulobacter sp. SLTY]|uniref:M56 family metallopeptidase n=1 Tax=Caulobacter sp. SLTY TaxID=2683262 RepID=UPI0014121EA0|nr:M56 family metallopeptidase [Caulobacter sp. SLTY]NBB17381.1 hypothetical protein [Caulobacter sp. SLTY]
MSGDLIALLLEINLALAAVILLVLALRLPVRRLAGPRHAYALWAVVPLAVLAVLMPARVVTETRIVPSIGAAQVQPATPAQSVSAPVANSKGRISRDAAWKALTLLWLGGVVLGLVIQGGRQARFLNSLGDLRREGARTFRAARPGVGPAVVGVLRPRIVLPADFDRQFTPDEQRVVLAHEQAHLAGGDAQINALVTALQCLFWFNPLVHLAANCLRVDQEIACDAAVLAQYPGERRRYGEVMLKTQLAPNAPPLGCHWPAGAARQLKERFGMLKVRPHGPARRLAGAIAIGLVAAGGAIGAWAAQPPRTVEYRTTGDALLARALFKAIRAKDPAETDRLIQAGANVNQRLPGEGTPLIEAARHGRLNLVQLLLAAGADPNLSLSRDGSPLIAAADHGHLEVVQALVEAGADVNGFVLYDETPLIGAARGGHLAIAAYLIDQGAEVNLTVPSGNGPGKVRSPLSIATEWRRTEMAAYLRSRGATG